MPPVFSAETHVVEPRDLWTRRLGGRGPRVVGDLWCLEDGKPLPIWGDIAESAVRFAADKTRTAEDLLGELDRAGIAGAVLYPTVAHRLYGCLDGEALTAALGAYNDWVLELAGRAPERLKAVTLLDVADPAAAARELERTAKAGAAGAMIPMVPSRGELGYEHPRYEPLWSAAERLGLPLSVSAGALYLGEHGKQPGVSITLYARAAPGQGSDPLFGFLYEATEVCCARVVVFGLVLAGVFARHPKLRLCVAGFGASWLPYTSIRADEQYETRPERVGVSDGRNTSAVFTEYGLSQERQGFNFEKGVVPSDHIKRHVFVTFNEDRTALRCEPHLPRGNLLWATQPEGPVPAACLAGLPSPELERLTSGNVRELYRF